MTEFKDDLHETNKLIREVILPHMVKLEMEIASLRKHVWPYVQARKEQFILSDLESKRDFLKFLDEDTVLELLKLKAKISSSSFELHKREYDLTKNFC
ncbi:hypothetical protein FK873_gp199 [Micromonas pusilla virus SP1]|jgi:hypothetical protein|uniref:Uncharacterized protein n=1 Tax=Micromonas pusilla virus SP1 TaxID=373996 RepID=G9E6B2_MPSP1|nr:hypothetical protein FK873_gp199 [Micromonas pusilla virus SP1]AET84939.1 hypothetical protein MPXG_00141 [Micromonas pusilla virus SP1]